MSKFPDHWATATLGTINTFKPQTLTPSDTPEAEFELYSVPAFSSDMPEIVRGASIGSTKQIVIPGDVLVCKINPRINRVWRVGPQGHRPQIASSEWIGVRAPGFDSRFLQYYFSSPFIRTLIEERVTGVGGSLTRAQPKRVATFPVPIASFSEQKRTADKLDSCMSRLNQCRQHLDQLLELLKRFRDAVLEAAVSGRLTKEWRELQGRDLHWKSTTLHDVGIVSGGLTKNGRRNALAYRKPYLRVANVYQGRLELDDVAEIGLTPEELAKTALRSGDLLIVEGNGSLDQIGRVALWEGQISECSHQNHLIRWRSTGVTPRFILYWLMSPRGRRSLMDLASTTTGLHTLSISKIQRVPVQVPPQDEQTEIVRRVEKLFSLADALVLQREAAIHHVERLAPAVLSKAFRGQLMAQDPGDESARDMLARIKARQKAVAKNGPRQRLARAPGPPQSVQEESRGQVRERKRA